MGRKWHALAALGVLSCAVTAAVATPNRVLSFAGAAAGRPEEVSYLRKVANLLRQSDENAYYHVWPSMKFGWQIVLGSFIAFIGAAFGSIGSVGGGGFFVPMPMLNLIIDFDSKSSVAISKCMIMGASVSTVYWNLKLKHPTLDMPLIDYDLALLIQPMLMLGISIGVIFNVIFPDWLVTVLLIILFLGISTKAFLKGIETWKKETIIRREAANRSDQTSDEPEGRPLPTEPDAAAESKTSSDEAVSILQNVYWKEFGLLAFVWIAFLVLQVTKNYMPTCSTWFWVLNLLQIPVSVGVTMYEGLGLMQGRRVISSKGNRQTNLKFHQLLMYCFFGITAGVVAGLLGVGGGSIMGPMFLELGIPPQVASATATLSMMFSSSMSVVEYYILKRFPVPYAVFFTIVAFFSAFVGHRIVRKVINSLGRASLIIFTLSIMMFISPIPLGSNQLACPEPEAFEPVLK